MIGLPPGTTRHVLRAHLNAAGARDVRGDGFAQFGLALGGTVVGPALVERLLGGFDDVRRGREIGLADFQVDHAAALRFQRTGAHQDVEGRFDADAGHSFCELHSRYTFLNILSLTDRHLAVGCLSEHPHNLAG